MCEQKPNDVYATVDCGQMQCTLAARLDDGLLEVHVGRLRLQEHRQRTVVSSLLHGIVRRFEVMLGVGADDDDVALEELFEDVAQHANERLYDSNSEEEFCAR